MFDSIYIRSKEHSIKLATIIGRLQRGVATYNELFTLPDDADIIKKEVKVDKREKIDDLLSYGMDISDIIETIQMYNAAYNDLVEADEVKLQKAIKCLQTHLDFEKRDKVNEIRSMIMNNMTIEEIQNKEIRNESYINRIVQAVNNGAILTERKTIKAGVRTVQRVMIDKDGIYKLDKDVVYYIQQTRNIRYTRLDIAEKMLKEYTNPDVELHLRDIKQTILFSKDADKLYKYMCSAINGHGVVIVQDNGRVLKVRIQLCKRLIDAHGAKYYKEQIIEEAKEAFAKETSKKTTKAAPLNMYKLDNILLLSSYEAEVIISLKKEVEEAFEK